MLLTLIETKCQSIKQKLFIEVILIQAKRYQNNSNRILQLPRDYIFTLIIINLLQKYHKMILQLNDMELSSVPTANHKQLLHIRLDEKMQTKLARAEKKAENTKQFFQYTHDKTHFKAYVDPSQLSYNSFENILQMDQCFFGPMLNGEKLKISIDGLQKKANYFQFNIHDPDNVLMELHKMDLYTLPFNNLSRGGKRMIFSSLKLSQILYQGIKLELQEKIEKLGEKQVQEFSQINSEFKSVNHVFRLNSFSPNSGNFKSHYDTPFSDQQRKLFSKFTLLIYLTGGKNEQKGCLRIKDEKINEIPAFTGIIFDQRHEHEGWPYVQGDKVFLRTQLIYFVKDIAKDKTVAELFNRACYFQKEAYYEHNNNQFSNELQKYSNDLFNHTAKMRYVLAEKANQIKVQNLKEGKDKLLNSIQKLYLMKKNLGVVYVTDGNSFWFREAIEPDMAAKLVLADYFNGRMTLLSSKTVQEKDIEKIQSKPLKLKLTQSMSNKIQIEESEQIKQNRQKQQQNMIDAQIIEYLDEIAFDDQKEEFEYPHDFATLVYTGNQDFDLQKQHCSIESPDDLTTSLAIQVESRQISLSRLKTKMHGVGVILFNGKLHINDSMVKVNQARGEISFNNAAFRKTINFAACQCDSYTMQEIIGKQTIQIQGFLLPKMNYHKFTHCKGYRISIDIFKNGFIHRINTEISRPYALDPEKGKIDEPFYRNYDQYYDSDPDFDEYTGKRYQEPEAMDQEENEESEGDIKKRFHV